MDQAIHNYMRGTLLQRVCLFFFLISIHIFDILPRPFEFRCLKSPEVVYMRVHLTPSDAYDRSLLSTMPGLQSASNCFVRVLFLSAHHIPLVQTMLHRFNIKLTRSTLL